VAWTFVRVADETVNDTGSLRAPRLGSWNDGLVCLDYTEVEMRIGFLMVLIAVAVSSGFSADWNQRIAADYLDARQKEWFAWPRAKVASSACVSCHTGLPYLIARPALRRALGESQPTSYEKGC